MAGWRPAKHAGLTLAAAALVSLPGMTQAAEPPCLTAGEFSALATYALPGVISDATRRCAASLPATAFLPGNGEALARRYGEAAPRAWPAAKLAFLKLSAGAGPDAVAMLSGMPDDSLQQLVGTLATQFAGQKLPTERCDTIDAATRILAPLPPENIGQLLALVVSRVGKAAPAAGSGRLGKLAICSATPAPPPSPLPPAPSAGKP